METLQSVFSKYNTDKNQQFHNYSRQYEALLEPYRNKHIKYLEIGVCHGESVNAIREVFPNTKCIVELAVETTCKIYENADAHIFIEIGNATDPYFINFITHKYGKFDVILDDGGHTNDEVIKTFELLFPLLNDNGLYIIEDTVCYKIPQYINPIYPNHLEYFFQYTQFLNQWRFDSTEGIQDNCIDPFKIMKKTKNVFEYSIDKIEYGCSYVAVTKKIREHWIP